MDAELRFASARQNNAPIASSEAVELAKDECRDGRPFAWLDHLRRDLHLAIRLLDKSPGFALAGRRAAQLDPITALRQE
jgi:hypothetical protein